jgi:hypothetical protein
MGLTAGRYSRPLERTAHAIRASLLAAAVMTTLIGPRSSSASSHAPNGDRSRLTRRTADRAPCTRILRRYERRSECHRAAVNLGKARRTQAGEKQDRLSDQAHQVHRRRGLNRPCHRAISASLGRKGSIIALRRGLWPFTCAAWNLGFAERHYRHLNHDWRPTLLQSCHCSLRNRSKCA